MKEEESSNGIASEEPTEKEILIQELIEKEDTAVQMTALKRAEQKAESPTQRGLERLSEIKIKELEIDERSSSSILRKTISEPQTDIEPATFW